MEVDLQSCIQTELKLHFRRLTLRLSEIFTFTPSDEIYCLKTKTNTVQLLKAFVS